MVVNGDKCRVARIDARTMRVVALIPVMPGSAAVRFGYGSVWLTHPFGNVVLKIDPVTNRVTKTTSVGLRPRFFGVGENGVWTLKQRDGSVTRLDPSTGDVQATIKVGIARDGDMTTAPAGRGCGVMVRYWPESIRERTRWPNGYGPDQGSGAVIVGCGAVWVSAHDVDTVY